MDSIIEFYEAGAPVGPGQPRPNAQKYKDRARQYKKMLREEYYDEENPRGVDSLYFVLKAKHPDDGEHPRKHPPKRFVADWLRRQGKHQVYRRKKGKAKSIQSVIVSKPNELIQVDYLYFFRNIAPMEEYEVKEIVGYANKAKTKVKVRWVGYDDEEPTVEPISQIENTIQYQKFLDDSKKK